MFTTFVSFWFQDDSDIVCTVSFRSIVKETNTGNMGSQGQGITKSTGFLLIIICS